MKQKHRFLIVFWIFFIVTLYINYAMAQSISLMDSAHADAPLIRAFYIMKGDIYSNLRPGLQRIDNQVATKPLLEAGLEYDQPWTRDISINSWNGSSYLEPEAVKRTLHAVLEIDAKGDSLIGGQYWDNILWGLGVWKHYLITGDSSFLKSSYPILKRTMLRREQEELDRKYKLFRGAAVYGDGVSAYDKRYTQTGPYTGDEWNCTITKWVEHNPKLASDTGGGLPMMTLSTNVVYYLVYQAMSEMETVLGLPNTKGLEKATKLKAAINKHLWNEKTGLYNYYIDPWSVSTYQEGLGTALILMSDIPSASQRAKILASVTVAPAGLPCVWPSYPRYRKDNDYGRHSGTVWGHILGFWGLGTKNASQNYFTQSLDSLSAYFVRDLECREIYHPDTSLPYGGLQEDGFELGQIRLWESTHKQTWTATAYLRLITEGVFGIQATTTGLAFQPNNYTEHEVLSLNGLKYRHAILDITLLGQGTQVESINLDGKIVDLVPADIQGDHQVVITLTK